jgi:hypothetical protein
MMPARRSAHVSDAITPFRIDFPEAAIDDLRERLRRTWWPEPGTVSDWPQGTPLAWIRELCRHWLEDYDFAAAQERLNQFPRSRKHSSAKFGPPSARSAKGRYAPRPSSPPLSRPELP